MNIAQISRTIFIFCFMILYSYLPAEQKMDKESEFKNKIQSQEKQAKQGDDAGNPDASAHLELTRLYKEAAMKGLKSFQDCRNEATKVLQITEGNITSNKEIRASAELINLECFFYEKNFNKMVSLTNEFETKYPIELKQLNSALVFKGKALRQQGKKSESHKVFEKIRLSIPDNTPDSELKNAKAESLYDLALWYRDQGDRLNENYTYDEIQRRFPDSEVTQNVTKIKEKKELLKKQKASK